MWKRLFCYVASGLGRLTMDQVVITALVMPLPVTNEERWHVHMEALNQDWKDSIARWG
jgi:hypothetical protein